MSTEPAWRPDPYGRYELRWHDGTAFTEHVSTGGVSQVDPMGASAVIPFVIPVTAVWPPPNPADRRG